jgi:hypothetical protein
VAPGASGAVGERSVSVAGDVVGSLIVTGDNNNVNLVLGSHHGALMEQLSRRAMPAKRPRPAPVRSVPPRFADSLDRESEVEAVLDGLRSRTPVNLCGPPGIGKTYAILAALNTDDPAVADGAVYLYAPGTLDDVLQLMFEAWYECDPPYKPSNPQLRRDLEEVTGLVALDSVELDRDPAQQVLLAVTGCRVLVASRERALTDGTSITLRGLEREYAVQVLERELGRPLADAECDDANRICDALEGHPLKIREAVASARDAGRSLSELAAELRAADAERAVSADKLRAAGEDGRRLLAALALFGDAAVGKEHLQAIADVEGFEDLLMAELRRRDVRAHSPRYNLGVTLTGAVPETEIVSAGQRALVHFTGWAEENRYRPAVLMTEAPALLAVMRWAVQAGRFREAIRLGRAVDHAFALGRRFGAWEQILKLVHGAALSADDREAEAWALHQLGTRELCLGDIAAGSAALGEAVQLRRELGDTDGAKYSARNVGVATRSKWLWHWIVAHSLVLGAALAVIVAGAVGAVTLTGGGNSGQTPFTNVKTRGGGNTGFAGSGNPQSTGSAKPPSSGGGHSGSSGIPPSTATAVLSLLVIGTGSVAVNPGQPSCSGSCVMSVKVGTPLNLVATPGPGFLFENWSGSCDGSIPTCKLPMTKDADVVVNFSPPVTLLVRADGVSVTSEPGGITCPKITCRASFPAHTTVTLSARPAAFWFHQPGCAGPSSETGSSTCPITLDTPSEVDAQPATGQPTQPPQTTQLPRNSGTPPPAGSTGSGTG